MTKPVPADAHALVGAYAVDALTDDERADFEAHLAGCDECRAEVAGLQQAASALSLTSELTPPASLRAGLLARLDDEVQEPAARTALTAEEPATADDPVTADVVVLPRRRVRLAALAAVAAVVAAIGLGSTVVDRFQQDDVPQVAPTLAERIQAADDVEEVVMEFPDGAKATVVRSRELGRALIVTENMPAPPPDSVYQLWFEDVEDGMVSAGVMPTTSDQTFLLQGQAEEARAVGITIEPEGGSVRPTTTKTVALFEFDPSAA